MARPVTGRKTGYASFRISEETEVQWEALAGHYGLSKTAVFEMLIRKAAREEGLLVKKEGREA